MAEQLVIGVAHKSTQLGGGLAFGSGLVKWISENHDLLAGLGIIAGICVGLAGTIVQFHFQRRRDRREQALYEDRIGDDS
jgi:hypothetical protein